MIKESGYYSRVIEIEFNIPLFMTKNDHEDFHNSTKFWICKKAYEEDEMKVKDQDNVTRKYRGSGHHEFHLNLSLSKKNPAVFYKFQNYGSHLIFQEIGKYNFKINDNTKNNIKVREFYSSTI